MPNPVFVAAKTVINLAVVEAVDGYRKKTGDWYFPAIISAHVIGAAYKSAVK